MSHFGETTEASRESNRGASQADSGVCRDRCIGSWRWSGWDGRSAWCSSPGHTVDAGGIGTEFERRAKEANASLEISRYQVLDTEVFKYIADQLVEEAGIVPLLHTQIVDVLVDDGLVTGVVTESKSGRQAILAKRVIDATGDADLAERAGAPFRIDPKEELEGATVNFGCSGVDVDAFISYLMENPNTIADWGDASGEKEASEFSTYTREPFDKAKAAGEMPSDVRMESYWGSFTDAGEIPNMNAIHMAGIDSTDVEDLTRGEIQGRQQVMWAVAALKKYAPGFENARLRTIGASIGCRESRKITGRYNLTSHDVLNQAEFADTIGIFPEFLDGNKIAILPSTGRYFQVPFGVTVPQGIKNLLVAGRCVAGDKTSHAATRQMMCCTVTGQGAGVASAISIEQGVPSGDVDIAVVQAALKTQGVRLT